MNNIRIGFAIMYDLDLALVPSPWGRCKNVPQPAAAGRYLLSVRPQPFADMSNDYRSPNYKL